jgi:outer membrane protein assembly factor BamD
MTNKMNKMNKMNKTNTKNAASSQFSLHPSTQRLGLTALTFSLMLSLSACGTLFSSSSNTPKLDDTPPEVLYKKAKLELNDSDWSTAATSMEKVQAADAVGIYGQQALLDMAYAQWKNNDSGLALVSVERYLRQFSKAAGVPYALYLKGMINFNRETNLVTQFVKEDLSERDPKSLQDSYAAFERLAKEFPSSEYAKAGIERMPYLVNTLAQHEANIALFYLQNKAPVAAIGRVQDLLKLYPQAASQEQGLGVMAEAYRQLGLTESRDNTVRVLQKNYPNSPYLSTNADHLYAAPTKSWFALW